MAKPQFLELSGADLRSVVDISGNPSTVVMPAVYGHRAAAVNFTLFSFGGITRTYPPCTCISIYIYIYIYIYTHISRHILNFAGRMDFTRAHFPRSPFRTLVCK
jgi:hypothetical protein